LVSLFSNLTETVGHITCEKRFAGDIVRHANTSEVKGLRSEARDMKEVIAEQTLEPRLLISRTIGVKIA
jgi:hypothetical protein